MRTETLFGGCGISSRTSLATDDFALYQLLQTLFSEPRMTFYPVGAKSQHYIQAEHKAPSLKTLKSKTKQMSFRACLYDLRTDGIFGETENSTISPKIWVKGMEGLKSLK